MMLYRNKPLSYWHGYIIGWWQRRRRYLLSPSYWHGRAIGWWENNNK